MDTPWLQGLDSWLFGLDNRHYRAWVAGRLAGIVRGPVVEVPIGGAPFLGTCPQYRELAWVGVDLSWTMLRRTQDKLLRTGADALLLRADAGHLPLRSGSMGAVVSLFGLHCFHDKPRVAKELRRSLALDGEVIISSLTLGTSALSDAYFHLLARDGTFDAGTTSARIKAVMTDAGFHGLRSECTGAALLLHGTVARQPALETSS
jgi:SAM-dependent methyltransferase